MNGAVAELLERCRAAGLARLVEGDSLHVDFESEPPVDLIREIRQHKPAVMAALCNGAAQMAEVIAPAHWVLGAAGSSCCCPDPPFEMPCPERRGVVERRDGVFLHFCMECGRWCAYGTSTLFCYLPDGEVMRLPQAKAAREYKTPRWFR